MAYDQRPWLKSYDPGVDPDLTIPDVSYVDLLEQSFDRFAECPAFHFLGASRTFADLERDSARFARFLGEIGCESGAVVGIHLPNIPQYMIAHAGTLRAGCIATGISPLLAPKEIAYQINDSGAKVLVTLDAAFEQRFLKIQDRVAGLAHVVVTNVGDFLPGPKRILGRLLKKIPRGKVVPVPGKTVHSFMEVLRRYPPRPPHACPKPQDICLIQYTGGTTGLPKGTELTHRNIVANIHQARQWFEAEPGSEVYCSGFPFFHMAGLILCMTAMGIGGSQVLIPDPRNTDHICKEIEQHRPTILANVPSLYQMLLDHPNFSSLDFSSVKLCLSGAAPFAVEAIRALEAVVGEGKVVEVYGMTETSPLLTMNPYRGRKKIGSVGVPIQSTWVRLMDLDTGTRQLPLGEEGEVVARGPQVMKGYLNKPEETAHVLREREGQRWLFTGDVGRMDADGFLYIVDRAKDMLNVSGFKVFSREVEETLYEHPAVEFCAIVGIPDPKRPGSERVKAVIQPTSAHRGMDPAELQEEILRYCRENMAPYKVPKIVEIVEEIPLTPVGKVDKKALK
jgi:acyl-CoA synthetase (AMP-forming)/AMP-acid ligase II